MLQKTVTLGAVKVIEPGVCARFEPQPDITTYELALLMPLFFGNRLITEAEWQAMGPEQRHLIRLPND